MRAATRWRRLVNARLSEMEALQSGPDPRTQEFWDSRAHRFAARTHGTAPTDPFLRRLMRVVGPESHVVDVGCGPGRFSLPLARRARKVTAVDLSPVMLSLVREAAREQGLANVATVAARWEEASVAAADVLVCSYVLPLVADAEGFLTRMEAAREPQQGLAFVYMNALSGDALTDPLWRRFHGRPRRVAPTHLDALEVLRDLGLEAHAEVVEVRNPTRFSSVAEAADHYGDMLLLDQGHKTRSDLEELLGSWLVGRRGALRPPLPVVPAAILRWPWPSARAARPRPAGGPGGREPERPGAAPRGGPRS